MSDKVRFSDLRRVFRSDRRELLDARIARLCVLYEDLRIELAGITEKDLLSLDELDPPPRDPPLPEEYHIDHNKGRYRSYYFLRRSTATLYEFAEAVRLLHECSGFQDIMSVLEPEVRAVWTEPVEFFRKHEGFIRNLRNDIGGHFGSKAASYAVENLKPVVGKVSYKLDERGGHRRPMLHFAGEIAAAALFRHLTGTSDKEKAAQLFEEVLLPGYESATTSVQFLLASVLWKRFGC